MEKILIAVGSTRKPKVEAVRDALGVIRPLMDGNAEFEIVPVEVPSGVRHTPLSREDLMAGARQRAEALVGIANESNASWKYFVGLEGGLDVIHESAKRWVFLESWAYVADDKGRGAFGRSGAVLLPEALAKTVVDDGVELSEAIDAFAGGPRNSRRAGCLGCVVAQSDYAAGCVSRRGYQRVRSVFQSRDFFECRTQSRGLNFIHADVLA